jgi:hypothetical protein
MRALQVLTALIGIHTGMAAGAEPLALGPSGAPPAASCALPPKGSVKNVDIREVANILRSGDFKKNEFETSAEFSKRTSGKVAEVNQLIAKTGAPSLIFGARIPEKNLKYDADRGIMKIGDFLGGGVLQRNSSSDAIIVSYSEVAVGSYEASNAFGARATVSRREASELTVTSRKPADAVFNAKPIDVPVPREEARDSKESIGVVFSAKLKSPYFTTGGHHLEPKIDFLFDYTIKTETIVADVYCAAFYNAATGRIIQMVALSRI